MKGKSEEESFNISRFLRSGPELAWAKSREHIIEISGGFGHVRVGKTYSFLGTALRYNYLLSLQDALQGRGALSRSVWSCGSEMAMWCFFTCSHRFPLCSQGLPM